jgi:hypothetical protein
MRPRKYFCATMFVAVCDQKRGNSTFFCSNAGPFLRDVGVAISHSTRRRVAALDREQPADGEAGVLVDDAVDELVGVDCDWAFLLYGRHLLFRLLRTFTTTRELKSFRFWGKGP